MPLYVFPFSPLPIDRFKKRVLKIGVFGGNFEGWQDTALDLSILLKLTGFRRRA